MPPSPPKRPRSALGSSVRRFGLGLLSLATLSACGASINAVYEGDVRFEHCMALDAQREVKPTIRRACWEEWTKFYTFGQTRDRIDYAQNRMKQLSGASDFDEAEWIPEQPREALAVPEPTTVLAPPPMMLTSTDAGASDAASDASADAALPDERPLPGAGCSSECEKSWTECRKDCGTAACERTCTGKYKRCMRHCF